MTEETTEAPKPPEKPIAIPVAWRDILPWTKIGCRSCEGRGVFTRVKQVEARFWEPVMRDDGTTERRIFHKAVVKRKHDLCGCAIKRFRKAQDCTVVNGQLFAIEPWVAVHPETVAEVVEHMEKEQAEALALASKDPEVDTNVVPAVEDKDVK